jgi:hypothetical protein
MILGLNYTRYRHRRLTAVEYRDLQDMTDYLRDTQENPTAKANRLLVSSAIDWSGKGNDLDIFMQKVEVFEPDIIFVDSAYLTRVCGEFAATKHTSTQNVAYAFKQLAREIGTPIVANGQANRKGSEIQGENVDDIANGDGWAQAADMVFRIINTPEDQINAIYNLLLRVAKGRNASHPGFSLTVQMGNMVKLHEAYENHNQISAKLKAIEKIAKMERDEHEARYLEKNPAIQKRRLGIPSPSPAAQAKSSKGGRVLGFPTRR